MTDESGMRPGERAVPFVEGADASLVFIGRISTPWRLRSECPRQGRLDGPVCRIALFEPWAEALEGLSRFASLEVLYWLHLARRDLVRQIPRRDGWPHGAFALRSPVRPNPIGTSIVKLERLEGANLFVRGLDCLDGTPLLDLKPDRSIFTASSPSSPAAT